MGYEIRIGWGKAIARPLAPMTWTPNPTNIVTGIFRKDFT